MGVIRLGLILWLAPVILLVALRLVPFVPMITFIAFAYVAGVLFGEVKLVNLNKWAVLPAMVVEHIEFAMVVLFVTIIVLAGCFGHR